MEENDCGVETLYEITVGNMFAEVVRGLKGVYISIQKGENSLCLTADESMYLKTLIRVALEAQDKVPE